MAATGAGSQKAGAKYSKREFVGWKNGKRVYRYWYHDEKKQRLSAKEVEEAGPGPKGAPEAERVPPKAQLELTFTPRLALEESLDAAKHEIASVVLNRSRPGAEYRGSWKVLRESVVARLVATGVDEAVAGDFYRITRRALMGWKTVREHNAKLAAARANARAARSAAAEIIAKALPAPVKDGAEASAPWGSAAQRAAQLKASLAAAAKRLGSGEADEATRRQAEEALAGLGEQLRRAEEELKASATETPVTNAERAAMVTAMSFVPDVVDPPDPLKVAPQVARRRRRLSKREEARKALREVVAYAVKPDADPSQVWQTINERIAAMGGSDNPGLKAVADMTRVNADGIRQIAGAFLQASAGTLDKRVFKQVMLDVRQVFRMEDLAAGDREFRETMRRVANSDVEWEAYSTFAYAMIEEHHKRMRKVEEFRKVRIMAATPEFDNFRREIRAKVESLVRSLKFEEDGWSSPLTMKAFRLEAVFSIEPREDRLGGLIRDNASFFADAPSTGDNAARGLEVMAALWFEANEYAKKLLRTARTERRRQRRGASSSQPPAASPPSTVLTPLQNVDVQAVAAEMPHADAAVLQTVQRIRESITGGIGRVPMSQIRDLAAEITDNNLFHPPSPEEVKAAWDRIPTKGFEDLASEAFTVGMGDHVTLTASARTHKKRVEEWLSEKAGGMTFGDILNLSGINDGKRGLTVEISPTSGGGFDINIASYVSDIHARRTIMLSPGGAIGMYNALFKVNASGGGGGYGMKMLMTQALLAERFRKKTGRAVDIETSAAAGNDWNGYYTWAQLGYDAHIDEGVGGKAHLRLSQILSSREGAILWKARRMAKGMKFDTTPGSYSMKRLETYARHRFGKTLPIEDVEKSLARAIDLLKGKAAPLPKREGRESEGLADALDTDAPFAALMDQLDEVFDALLDEEGGDTAESSPKRTGKGSGSPAKGSGKGEVNE